MKDGRKRIFLHNELSHIGNFKKQEILWLYDGKEDEEEKASRSDIKISFFNKYLNKCTSYHGKKILQTFFKSFTHVHNIHTCIMHQYVKHFMHANLY